MDLVLEFRELACDSGAYLLVFSPPFIFAFASSFYLIKLVSQGISCVKGFAEPKLINVFSF